MNERGGFVPALALVVVVGVFYLFIWLWCKMTGQPAEMES